MTEVAEFNLELCKDYTMFHRNLDTQQGRGLILYVHNSLKADEVRMETDCEENLFIKVKVNTHEQLLVGLVYRSPSDNSKEAARRLRTLLKEAADMKYAHHLIIGDFNYPLINWESVSACNENSDEEEFINCLNDNYLFQHVTKPTRWRGSEKPNLLDLIITKEENLVEDIEYQSPLGKSDHCVIRFNYRCKNMSRGPVKMRRLYRKGNYEEMKKELKEMDWNKYLLGGQENGETDINYMWSLFKSKVLDLENKFVPLVKVGGKKGNQIPLEKETLSAIKEKNSLNRKFIHTKDPKVRTSYNRARNKVSKLVRRARKKYEQNLALEAKKEPKRIWQFINSKSKTRQGIGELHVDPSDPNSVKTDDDAEKADILANFFSGVFTKEPSGELPELEPRNISIPWSEVNIEEDIIRKLLSNLNSEKSPGPDQMHPRLFKELSQELAQPLRIIFEKSIRDRQVPDEWKVAKISAIYKKGPKSIAGNYRPVSLTSIVCKIMEKIVRNHITKYFLENDLFTKRQYGFMSGRSTAIQLLKVLDEWTEAIDNGQGIDCIYMDYKKAFDTVPHQRLLKKLEAYQLGPSIIEWIMHYLQDRKQQVSVNGQNSTWHRVTSGIPQGSVVGPLLFVIFINDLPDIVESTVYLFADDTKIFKVIEEGRDKRILQKDLESLTDWSDKWLLKFHPDKCKYLHIGKHNPASDYQYQLMGKTLEKIEEEKDIGVYVDESLSFDKHICEKVKKATSMSAIIRRIFQHLDERTFVPLYKSLVRTHFDYASSVWYPYKAKHIEMIENVQRRATKQLPGFANLSYPERLRKLKLPTLTYRRYRGDMIELYKITSRKYDTSAGDFLKMRDETALRKGGRGNSKKILIQRANLEVRRNSFCLRSAAIWNSLPEDVISAKTLNTFKNRLDKYWEGQEVKFDNYRASITTGSHKFNLQDESSKEDLTEPALENNAK
ncbi:hypothetical protein FSP39_011129 [Pinctada imbricata]|uniref:Reverse transcriptase domain-containing protein n=1 Tax=Pinctada imbricata TaxID=66713 RepID=A0AA88XRJ0_PINIB|nr:hypothetical protein FSP39_011129 [Pinctada imbricata]